MLACLLASLLTQYLLQPFNYGNLKVKQEFTVENDPHEPTDWEAFVNIQDGRMPSSTAMDDCGAACKADGDTSNWSNGHG